MYSQDKVAWQALQRRGMSRDYSWGTAAVQYEALFLGLMGHPVPSRPSSAASTSSWGMSGASPGASPSSPSGEEAEEDGAQQQTMGSKPMAALAGSAAAAAAGGALTAAKAAQAIEQSQRQSEWLAKQAQGLDLRQQAKTVLQGLWLGLN